MTRVTITAPAFSYEATIETGLLRTAGPQLRTIFGVDRKLFVVTVPPVRRRWGKKLFQSLSAAGFSAKFVEMQDGERNKRLATVEKLAETMVRFGADRGTVILAFGGGVVGDVAGLLASTYMRGVDLVQIPTTVLAQVDASIGGKTGVNLRAGKNLLGTFYQPRAVLIDPAVLATLPERQFRAGLYEVLKCGIIGRPELFVQLGTINTAALRRDPATLENVIAEAVKLKAEIVSKDERENDLRRVLNLGHTIGHALEADSQYRRFLHGEAVAWGMIAAAHIASAVGTCDKHTANQIREATLRLGNLPSVQATSGKILNLVRNDKKTRNGIVHFVLPRRVGRVEIVNDVPEKIVVAAVDELRRMSRNFRRRGTGRIG